LIVRVQETTGQSTTGMLVMHSPAVEIAIPCRPYEIKTFRIDKDGGWREVAMIEEV
jgi:hypothetical protein